ncbi:MAG: hypothetical protein ACI8W3_001993 [Myxococcota bacterium]|jgi:hypothetical protein
MTAWTRDDLRYEIKFAAPSADVHALHQWIAQHPAGVRNAYPSRRVNNIYFDTHDLRCYREVGSAARDKVRLRWYGDTTQPDASTLEIKRRRNRVGWKQKFDVGGLGLEGTRWRPLLQDVKSRVPAEALIWLNAHPVPVLINQYNRDYYESADRKVRLTIDRGQAVFGQNAATQPKFRGAVRLPDWFVVEIKFAMADEKLGNEFIQGIPIRASRNSKYALGAMALFP